MAESLDALLDLRRRLYRVLDAGSAEPAGVRTAFTPPLDVTSTPEGLTITVELPGVPREDIVIELQGNLLTIAGERKGGDESRFYRRERPCGQFRRSLTLPTTDHNELSAGLKDGILTVRVRKPAQAGAS